MKEITPKLTDGILYLPVCGRIDSANAADVEASLREIISGYDFDGLVLDVDKLDYISSAGLRIVLRLRKENPSLKIINASPEIYEIFDMTGFTEMIPVEKAYRKLSVDGCEVIGRGANGEVFRLDPDTIIKVYYNPDALPDIHHERELARRAFVLGVPTAIPYDVVRVGEGYGSVFELLNAKSLAKLIAAEPESADKYIDMFVELLKTIHATEVRPEDMPDMKAVAIDWVEFLRDYLAPDKWQKLKSLVSAVPEGHKMIHGDYHTKNVMLQNGEALLIDMDTLSQGDPIFEFASIYNAFKGFSDLDHAEAMRFQGLDRSMTEHIWDRTLSLYLGTDDENVLRDAENKSKLMGYTRLMRRTIRRHGLETDEGRKKIAYYKEQIESLVDSVDKLTF